ncbi:MAG: valine--tRNA ligase [Bacteroidetes bacterium]|nr:valine--tRNA ligase [Bacteroidota bacterium]
MSELLPKAYTPTESEHRWYAQWEGLKDFSSHPDPSRQPFSVLMPPPNVTGILHFGHVLNNTLQDIYTRWNRLLGNEACWFPGLDHAGIATQTKVEQELRKEGKTRYDLGRDAFVDRVWTWKEKYGGIIFKQMRALGVSPDWDRTLFTMDESASEAVRDVFITLFDEGLIYRGKRIINWSPVAQSALSDEEVLFREVKEHIYSLRYRLEDGSGALLVATVRPETIFADVAVAVNPSDERYKHLIGKNVIVPIGGQVIPIIADDYADPEFGTGCVKVTPAHDPNDFEIGIRHGLAMPSCINADATLNELAGEFSGLDRFVARRKVVAALEAAELMETIEDYTHNVGFSERGGEVVEPYLSDQWFVNMKPLAAPALKVVLDGEITFFPDHWVRVYEHWMTNIRDWCISRQLWWGHRIPVYYTEDGRFTAARSEAEARTKLGISENETLRQDPDVLDTWFSSWLWPMTTMGWRGPLNDNPTSAEASNALMSFYLPTNLLVTAPEIIFFWVARMIMATLKYKQTIPFKTVYFTSIIRDIKGRKLSKSLGNSPDPLDIVEKYGADAVRFTMIYLSPLGQDVRMEVDEKTQDIATMEIGRNFANKIWNAARFLQMKKADIAVDASIDATATLAESELTTADRWIRSRYNTTLRSVSQALENYKITDYGKLLYDFVWRDFCDWYVEVVKVQYANNDNAAYRTRLMNYAFGIFEGTLKVLHPVMPFLTEELWHGIYGMDETQTIDRSAPPIARPEHIEPTTEATFDLLQNIVESVRRQRNEMLIPPSERLPLHISSQPDLVSFFEEQRNIITTFCRVQELVIGSGLTKPSGSVADVVRGVEMFLLMEGKIDFAKERARLEKELTRLKTQVVSIEKKLGNEGFVRGAKPEVIENERQKLVDFGTTIIKIENNLASLQ